MDDWSDKTVSDFQSAFIEKQDVIVKKSSYSDGSIALQLKSLQGEPLATASVNLGEVVDMKQLEQEFGRPVIFIKDYSENQGVAQALTQGGIIEPLDRYVRSGFVTIQLFALL